MSYLDHDGLAYFKSKLDRTFIADIEFDDGDIKLYGGDGTLLKTVVQEGTVTQKKSTANKEYPVLLCWDADAEEDQTMKTVWYGLDTRINPKFGYLYARRYYTEHPSYERTEIPSARAEWHHIFTDAVSAPMGEVYEYLDRIADGGEHRMELRLYGNPLSQYVDTPNHNEATDAVSLGLGATRGEKLTFFGYAPSTPIYLEDGSTMRKSLARGDQYGKDIITRDWLNLNGSITGLVHTYMDETIDGYKTFLKTVTIDSGDDNNKAGLNVQGNVNIDSGDNTKPSNLYVQGNSHIRGNEDIDGNLNVDGASDQHGNVHMYQNLDVDGNTNTDGNITVGGTINKVSGNTTQEYVTYVTNQADTRKNIAAGLVDANRGIGYDASTGKIYIKASTDDGLKFNSNGTLAVDFSQMPTDKFEALLKGLKMQIPLSANLELHVDDNSDGNSIVDGRGTAAKPFKSLQSCITWAVGNYSLGRYNITILVHPGNYEESITLTEYNTGQGRFTIKAYDRSNPPLFYRDNAISAINVRISGGIWALERLNFRNNPAIATGNSNSYPYCLLVSSGAQVSITACRFEMNYNGASTDKVRMFLIAAEGGKINFNFDSTYNSSLKYHLGNGTYLHVLTASMSGSINFTGTFDSNQKTEILCEGDCDHFAICSNSAFMGTSGGGNEFTHCVVASGKTCTGKKYEVSGGAGISLMSYSFPGDIAGTADASTFGWYTGA